MSKLSRVSQIEIVEWYDGLVSGIVHAGEDVFFVYLLAFAPDLGKRKFAILSLSAVDAAHLEAAIRGGLSEAIQSSLLEIGLAGKRVSWTSIEPRTGEPLDFHEFEPGQLLEIDPPVFPCIDRASDEAAIARWLHD